MNASPSIEILSSEAEIEPSLWEACFPPPLEGRWWYRALENSGLEAQFVFRYALLRDKGREVGIAPLFQMDVPIEIVMPEAVLPLFAIPGRLFPSLLTQRTLFVGSPCADEGHVGLLPGVDRRDMLLCLQQALAAEARRLGAPMLVWKDFPDSWRSDLVWLADQAGLFPMVSYPGTLADLPGPDKADYFAALKGTRRHILRKKLRWSAERVEVLVEDVQHPEGRVLEEIFGLFWQTYERSATKFERLDRRFFEQMAALPLAHFLTLRETGSGDMIAFMLCFDQGKLVINKFIGLDYARPKEWLLYFRLWEAVLDWSLSRGSRAIQSGQTGYGPKIEMGHALVPLTNYCRHRNPVMHQIYKAVARSVTWGTLDSVLGRYE
ncbi:MAG: GNAT family N-acetyltransferase [Humidesulfovibrio sp.]|nr:GNAT family N-acetyltransferase [Humidesulfovibrio sp.]